MFRIKRRRKLILFALISLIIILASIFAAKNYFDIRESSQSVTSISPGSKEIIYPEPIQDGPSEKKEVPQEEVSGVPKPEKVLLGVPFISQAPNANWDPLHEEACEEASLIMAKHYLDRTPFKDIDSADREMTDLVHYQESNNYGPSVSVSDLNQIAKNYLGLSGRIIENVTSETLKEELYNGNVVILPAAGKLLKNPNFRNGGPNYHMLVVKGFDKDNFITNDPGTRKGENYIYNPDLLMDALHDWDPVDILRGAKNVLVFGK